LDNLVRFDPVNIAHEFNLNLLPISRRSGRFS
jgi:hypothetical protein